MRNVIIVLLMSLITLSTSAQRKTATSRKSKPQTVVLVTKSMSDKIADFCLSGQGYGKAVFYEANSKFISFSDIASGKGNEVLNSLSKYPKYSENFIYGVYKTWGYDGLREVGFTGTEITKAKQIVAKRKKENAENAEK